MSVRNTNQKLNYMVKIAILIALILLLEATGLGLLKFGVVEITTFVIPVAIGAIILGPTAGGILGLAFGLISLWECVTGKSAFGVALFDINPFYTVFMCIVPRFLCGWLAGFIYRALKKIDKTKFVRHAGAALSCALLNTIFFLVTLMLLFGSTDFIQGIWESMAPGKSVILFLAALVGVNGVIEAASCGIVGAAVARALDRD